MITPFKNTWRCCHGKYYIDILGFATLFCKICKKKGGIRKHLPKQLRFDSRTLVILCVVVYGMVDKATSHQEGGRNLHDEQMT